MKLPSISALLPQLPADKANHALYGIGMFIALALVVAPGGALAGVIVAGVAKEVYDKLTASGTPDPWDAVATSAGGIAGFVCVYLPALRM